MTQNFRQNLLRRNKKTKNFESLNKEYDGMQRKRNKNQNDRVSFILIESQIYD